MSKQKNLRYQFVKAINNSFREEVDKHSYKAQNGNSQSDLIFSHTSRINMKKMAVNFCNYMKENYSEVKQIRDINTDHVQNFLDSKSDSCNQETLKAYKGNMKKLEKVINNTYESANLHYSEDIKTPKSNIDTDTNRGVQAQMSRENYNKVLESASNSNCQSAYAIRLQEHLGVRVSELATIKRENVHIDDGYIHLSNTKGGREMDRYLNDEGIKLVKEILDKNFSEEQLFSNKSASINKYLRKTEDDLEIEYNSIHDVRRLIAQEHYDSLREQGYTVKEAAD